MKQLNKIRNNNYSNYELTTLLKKLSNNYELDLLQSLLSDIEFYLFVEKDIKESEFTSFDVEDAIQILIENNIEIPYYKRTPFEQLTNKGKELAIKLKENGFPDAPVINKEQLLFPFEFYDIYRFKNLIKSKLNALPNNNEILKLKTETLPTEPAPDNSLNWIGSQTEFIELTKALIENGNIKGTQTEIIKNLSNVFNIEIKHPNKLITDIKTRNNGSETLFINKLHKSLFDYITHEKKK